MTAQEEPKKIGKHARDVVTDLTADESSSAVSDSTPVVTAPTAEAVAKPRKVGVKIVVAFIILIGLVLIGTSIGVWMFQNQVADDSTSLDTAKLKSTDEVVLDRPAIVRVDNPVDFTSLQAINPDIYAWLTVPGTQIDYPVLQSATDDTFYLNHDYTGAYYDPGSIYSEAANSTDFNDPVTLIYGHNGFSDIMFTTLHYFEDEAFFNAHEYFIIYTPGHILTYRIVSAYGYDDRHIVNTFDFSKEEVVVEYFEFIKDPAALYKNVRTDVELDSTSKVVQLSTCMTETWFDARRYLVTGVLIQDQLTN